MPVSIRSLGTLAALAILLGAASAAQAAPITFAVDSSQSVVDVSVTAVGSTGTDAVAVSGTSTAELALGASPSLEVLSSSLALDPYDILIDLGFIGTVNIASANSAGDFFGGPTPGTALGPDAAEFDLAGYEMRLDQGTVDVSATGLASGVVTPSTRDLAAEPISFLLPTTISDVQTTPLGGGLEELAFTVPLDVNTQVDVSGQSADLAVQGDVVLTHTRAVAPVPEPGTATLTGLGLLGLARAGRRLRSAA